MMEEKERMVRLLNRYIDGPGLTVVIGAEHTAPGLRPFSLIAATAVDGGATRTVGVIGPTRMRLFARHCAGGRDDAGGVPRPARRQLGKGFYGGVREALP